MLGVEEAKLRKEVKMYKEEMDEALLVSIFAPYPPIKVQEFLNIDVEEQEIIVQDNILEEEIAGDNSEDDSGEEMDKDSEEAMEDDFDESMEKKSNKEKEEDLEEDEDDAGEQIQVDDGGDDCIVGNDTSPKKKAVKFSIKKLLQDVITLWWSTYMMISCLVELKRAVWYIS